MMTLSPDNAVAFVERHGVVLESGRGPVPSLAEAVAGGTIRGSWWGHPESHAIFVATRAVRASPDVLVCRLVNGKVTYVYRRLWPALVRLAGRLDGRRLAMIREEHTASGAHRVNETPFPDWVPPAVNDEARRLSDEEALQALGSLVGELR
jgi:hypothetical protein